MFWKRKAKGPRPETLAGNPGLASEGRVTLTVNGRERAESVDLLDEATAALKAEGHTVARGDGFLELPDSGFTLLPLLAEVEAPDDGGCRTVTTMQFHHPELVPDGSFEYQHSAGDTVAAAVRSGFEQWAKTDLVALLAAVDRGPGCMNMVAEMPDGRRRRVVFGPVAHFQSEPLPADPDDEHPFCNCCLFTKCDQTFVSFLDDTGFLGLRLYAAQEPDGTPQADCRVNGEDFPAGMDALRGYAATWPNAGYEFRKQFVVLHDLAGDPG